MSGDVMEFRIRTTCEREVILTQWQTPLGRVVRFAIVEEPGADAKSDDWCDEFDLMANDPAVEMLGRLLVTAALSGTAATL